MYRIYDLSDLIIYYILLVSLTYDNHIHNDGFDCCFLKLGICVIYFNELIMRGYVKRVFVFLKDKEKKSWWLIVKEVFQLIWMKKQFPLYYFGRFFFKKNAPCPMDYMNLNEYQSIIYSPKLERKATSSLLSNK